MRPGVAEAVNLTVGAKPNELLLEYRVPLYMTEFEPRMVQHVEYRSEYNDTWLDVDMTRDKGFNLTQDEFRVRLPGLGFYYY